jgi:hypothetical protein
MNGLGNPVTGGDSPPLTHYTNQKHVPGEHNASCAPPADPRNPELRLLRAIFGLCAFCDSPLPHEHSPAEIGRYYGPSSVILADRLREAGVNDIEAKLFLAAITAAEEFRLAPADPGVRTCKHCYALISAQGPRPDWASLNPQPGPALWCPDAPGDFPLHEPEATR